MNDTPQRDPTGLSSAYDRLRGKPPSELQLILQDTNRPSAERQATASLLAASDLDEDLKTHLLVRCLDDTDVMVQRVAICDVARLQLAGAGKKLRTMMWDESPNQVYVLRSLAILGDAAVIAPCEVLLRHEAEARRLEAVIALGFLDSAEAEQHLERCLKSDRSREVRLYAALGLAKPGNQTGVPVLKQQLGTRDKWQNASITVALARLGCEAGLLGLKELIAACTKDDERFLRMVLLESLRLEELKRDDWKEAVVHWADRELARKRAGEE